MERSVSAHVRTAILFGSFALDAPDPLHDLVRTARAGSPEAILEIVAGVRRAVTALWPELSVATIVPVPRHVPGPAHGLVVAVCDAIADARGWRMAADSLRRTRPAPEGKVGGTRDPETEAATLTWDGSTPGPVIVLVDDVVRSGATMNACVSAVRASGDERTLLAVALARAKIQRTGLR